VTDRPFLSLLTTVRSGVGVLPSLMSLLDQKDGAWQWCIVVASGIAPGTFREIRDLVRAEPRVQLINGAHLATNDLLGAVADLAAGEYLAHFAQGARLDPDTVGVVRLALDRADWAYTDESTEGVGGNASGVWLKPDYSPELLRSQPYALHLAAVPAVLIDPVGGFSARRRDAAACRERQQRFAWASAVRRGFADARFRRLEPGHRRTLGGGRCMCADAGLGSRRVGL
jgi:hypothetical protein